MKSLGGKQKGEGERECPLPSPLLKRRFSEEEFPFELNDTAGEGGFKLPEIPCPGLEIKIVYVIIRHGVNA
jgi:hypothetical protein